MKSQIVFSIFPLFLASIYTSYAVGESLNYTRNELGVAGLGASLRYTLINDLHVAGASANEIWALFASNYAPHIFFKILPGNGGVGSLLRIVYPKRSIPRSNKEIFMTIDNRRPLKEVLQTEGGYLAMGVTFLMESFQIFPEGRKSCIIRSMVRYTVSDQFAPDVTPLISVEGLVSMAKAAAKYVIDHKKKLVADY
ncbi:hypothetical protein MKX01_037624 [Papaver californicum]|nr:hypothetical protein MKX01_037624 [Papaver californicum]